MKLRLQNFLLLLFLLIASFIEAGQRYLSIFQEHFWSILAGLLLICLLTFKLKKPLFWTMAFFTIIHFTLFVNKALVGYLGIDFNGTYFLIPTLVFTLMIVFVPQVKQTINWWRIDKLTEPLIWQMIIAWALGSIGMFLYLSSVEPHQLERFLDMLPSGSWLTIAFGGIAFALLNAAVEEYIIRGMIWNGLEMIIHNPYILILTQAIIFGLSHYFGLPGGVSGVLMVFTWSLFLGYVRWKSEGLLTVIALHFGANLAQFFMLYAFK